MSDKVAAIHRQLKIKSGVVNRLLKEHNSYRTEAEQQKRKLDKFVADEADDWDIGNARRMMDESNKMIDDSARRLGAAVDDLRSYLVTVQKEAGMTNDKELLKAEEALQIASV